MKRKKTRSFFADIARFFNPQKSGTNADFDINGRMISLGTNQRSKYFGSHAIRFFNNKMDARGKIVPHRGAWI